MTGTGGAPDGDEWFAAALVFAHNRWGDTSGKYNYGTEAQKTLDLVRTTDFNQRLHLVRYFTRHRRERHRRFVHAAGLLSNVGLLRHRQRRLLEQRALTATRAWLQTAAGSTGNIGDQSSFAGADDELAAATTKCAASRTS